MQIVCDDRKPKRLHTAGSRIRKMFSRDSKEEVENTHHFVHLSMNVDTSLRTRPPETVLRLIRSSKCRPCLCHNPRAPVDLE
jgi:hypothetical protein